MVGQSAWGIERNRKVQKTLACLLVIVVLSFLIYTKLSEPSKNSVDGTYKNSCCGDIVIRRGHLSYGNASLDMKLLKMKFGLIGYVAGRFTKSGVTPAEGKTAISFTEGAEKRALSLPIGGRDYTFQSITPPAAR